MQRTTPLVLALALLATGIARAQPPTSVTIDVGCHGHTVRFSHHLDGTVNRFTDNDPQVTVTSEIISGADPATIHFTYNCRFAATGHRIDGVAPIGSGFHVDSWMTAPIGKPANAVKETISNITLDYTLDR